MLLTRDEILKAEDIQYETVPVPEWAPGGTVRVKTLSGEERDERRGVGHRITRRSAKWT